MTAAVLAREYINPVREGHASSDLPNPSAPASRAEDVTRSKADELARRSRQKALEATAPNTSEAEPRELPYANAFVLPDEPESSNVLPLSRAFTRAIIGKRSVNTLQEWEGYVEEIDGTSFVAVLRDLTDKNRGAEHATIPVRTLDKSELPFLKRGAIFRLIVGLAVTSHGNRVKDTIIYFRRYVLSKPNAGKELAEMIKSFRE